MEFAQKVEWEITSGCNLNCLHCNASSKSSNDLTTTEAMELAKELVKLKPQIVSLTGGEPTTREDWPILAKILGDGGVKTQIITNGTNITQKFIENVKSSGVELVWISIDGPQNIHDSMRGSDGVFSKAIEGAKTLKKSGIAFGFLTTLIKSNYDQLQNLSPLINELDPHWWYIWLATPTDKSDRWIRPDHMKSIFKDLINLKMFHPQLIIGDNIGYGGDVEHLRHHGNQSRRVKSQFAGCDAGNSIAGITARGAMKGCMMLPTEPTTNSIRNSTLSQLYDQIKKEAIVRKTLFSKPLKSTNHNGCHAFALAQQSTNMADFCYYKFYPIRSRRDIFKAASLITTLFAGSLFLGGCHNGKSNKSNVEKKPQLPETSMGVKTTGNKPSLPEDKTQAKTTKSKTAAPKVKINRHAIPLSRAIVRMPSVSRSIVSPPSRLKPLKVKQRLPSCCYSRAVIPNCNCTP
jgi:MoaA/NifB/PqqE/SkfB family radical SAM enzyme